MKNIVSGDGSKTLFNETYEQTYHSIHGALTESELVYLGNSGTKVRLLNGLDSHILEIGFGLGLNFLLTARCAYQANAKLDYLAFENAPITRQTFESLQYDAIDGLKPLVEPTAEIFEALKTQARALVAFNNDIRLAVNCSNACDADIPVGQFDAVYLDAFSPDVNPELWSVEFLRKLYAALKPQGRLTTYCVKGTVRRALLAAGFSVEKVPGPPGKREVLISIKDGG